MVKKLLPWAIAIVFLALVGTYIISKLANKANISKEKKFVQKNKRFLFYYDFFLTRGNFRKVYTQIANLSVYTLMESRMTAVEFYERSLILSLAGAVVAMIGFQDFISSLIILLIARVFMDMSVYRNIDKVNFLMEKELLHALTALSKAYTRCRNIPDALNEIEVGPLVKKQFNELYDIVVSSKGKEKLQAFYRMTPNRTLHTLATACWTLNDQGDSEMQIERTSINAFQLAIQMLKSDLTIEHQTHFRQNLLFKTVIYVPLAPLAGFPIIQMLLRSIFPSSGAVYSGSAGYLCKILMLLVTMVSYYAVSTINSTSVSTVDDRIKFVREMLKNEKIMRLAETLLPYKLVQREKISKRIDKCLSSKDLTYFYLEKYLIASVVFVLSIIASIFIVFTSRNVIYNNIRSVSFTDTTNYTAAEADRIMALDIKMLAANPLPGDDEIREEIVKAMPRLSAVEVDAQVMRIRDKYTSYHNTHFYWWFAFVYLAAGGISWFVPDLLLLLRSIVVRSEAQLDVLQLQTVVAILSSTSFDTMDILLWMSKSSDIHKDVLTTCYHEYPRDPKVALYKLRRSSAVEEFTAMCDDLLTTVHMVSISEAFSNLVTDRETTLNEREAMEAHNLNTKRALASVIVQVPVWALVILGMLVPLGVMAFSSFTTTFTNLS